MKRHKQTQGSSRGYLKLRLTPECLETIEILATNRGQTVEEFLEAVIKSWFGTPEIRKDMAQLRKLLQSSPFIESRPRRQTSPTKH